MSQSVYMCPTPKQHCCGALGKFSASLDKQSLKKHGSAKEAMDCYSRYLVTVEGCERLSNREFRQPEGKGIIVLSKPHSFGAKMRKGKGGEQSGSNRSMPSVRHGGIIISN